MRSFLASTLITAVRRPAAFLCLVPLLLACASPARAALSEAQLATVQAAPQHAARVPLDLSFTDLRRRITLGAAMGGRPSLLMLADYRCTQLCGSMLGIAAQALHASGLKPQADFNLILVGFNPDARATDAAAMRDGEIAAFPDLRAEAAILTGSSDSVSRLESSLGFTAIRDQAAGRYAHPAELYVLTADGQVSRVVDALSLEPGSLRLALVEAGQGRIGTLADRLHVLCYGLDPLAGASDGLARFLLSAGAGLTIAGLGLVAAVQRRRGSAAG
jgi:protein SCO1